MRLIAAVVVMALTATACGTDTTEVAVGDSTAPTVTATTSAVVEVSTPTESTDSAVVSTSTSVGSMSSVPVPSPPIDGWRSTGADPSAFGSVTITDAVAVGDLVIVAGCTTIGVSESEFPVWVTEDAVVWERATGPEQIGPFPVDCLTDMVATPFGIFAHGVGLVRSTDGRLWEPVEFLTVNGYPIGNVDAMFATADRLTVLLRHGSLNESTIATLFTTTDGTNWREGPAGSASLFDNSGLGDVLAVEERLIAVGASPWGEFVPTAAVWTSSDGLVWRLVTPPNGGFADAYMHAIINTGDEFVAVGGNPFDTGLMATWTSPDGVNWRRLPSPDEATDPNVAYMEAVAITRIKDTIYAAGTDFDARRPDGRRALAALWTSSDGTTWERVDFAALPGPIPFTIIDFKDESIGFWPPPFWPNQEPVQVFTTEQ